MADPRFYQRTEPFTLNNILEKICLNLSLPNDARLIHGVKTLAEAQDCHITFFHNSKYLDQLKNTKAAACLIDPRYLDALPQHVIALTTETPYRFYAKTAQLFHPTQDPEWGISPTAVIAPDVQLPKKCFIGPYTVINKNVEIGEETVIGAHCFIEQGTVIGKNCCIDAHVTISHALIGNQVTIQSGARIGQSGFGFDMDDKGFISVPQLGRVIIDDDVHIGANVTIDRGAGPDTIIGKGSRIDNLVQIAHNVQLGPYCVIVAQTGIAGSTSLGKGVVLGGQVGIAGHLVLEDGVRVAAQSGVMKNISAGQVMAGSPCVPIQEWHRQTISLKNLTQKKGKS